MNNFIYKGFICSRLNSSDWTIKFPNGEINEINGLTISQLYNHLDDLLEYDFKGHLVVWNKVLNEI